MQVEVVLKDVQPERKVGAVGCEVELVESDVCEACHGGAHGLFDQLRCTSDFSVMANRFQRLFCIYRVYQSAFRDIWRQGRKESVDLK